MPKKIKRVAFISDYMPRKCGIAVFTTDLCEAIARAAPDVFCTVVAMNDTPEGYDYPPRVSFQVTQNRIDEYQSAADYINVIDVQAVCVQHEFGIYGGPAGAYLLKLLRELRVPIVSTLHTVLTEPTAEQRRVFDELARLSDRMVVMSRKAVGFLKDIYGVPKNKIVFIHHGVPDAPFADPNFYKDLFSVEGRKVILTFGLLSPGKGIENVISAMPKVVEKHPDAVYIVLGATHPNLVKLKGEEYRFGLQALVEKLGLADNVIFHNRFVTSDELRTFLGAADVCVTPYPNEAQITSGTLANYVGYGKAVVSTPYWHAEEMLDKNRGVLVPFKDPGAIADAVIDLFDNEVKRHAMRKRAYTFGRKMIWPAVAAKYLSTFAKAREERGRAPKRATFAGHRFAREVPKLKFDHLQRLTDDTGIFRHARQTIPHRAHGYALDDNATALVAVSKGAKLLGREGKDLRRLACTYLSFIEHAFIEERGRFRSRMDYSRRWQDGEASEDSHGRALWGLGAAAAYADEPGLVSLATNLFLAALAATRDFTSPRAVAFSVVGIHEYLRRFGGDAEARRVREEHVTRLFNLFEKHATDDWPWFEDTLTYSNARFPQVLMLAGQWMDRWEMVEMGVKALGFLVGAQKSPEGRFAPVGTNGWYPRGGEKARFDQRPAEAQATMDACTEAWHVTRDRKWLEEAKLCYEWFLGANDLGLSLYDHLSGGCRDRLHPDHASRQEGAEATVSWLLSAIAMEEVRSEEEVGPAVKDEDPADKAAGKSADKADGK